MIVVVIDVAAVGLCAAVALAVIHVVAGCAHCCLLRLLLLLSFVFVVVIIAAVVGVCC